MRGSSARIADGPGQGDRSGFQHESPACDFQSHRRILLDQQHAETGAFVELDNPVEHLLDHDRGKAQRRVHRASTGFGRPHQGAADGQHLLLAPDSDQPPCLSRSLRGAGTDRTPARDPHRPRAFGRPRDAVPVMRFSSTVRPGKNTSSFGAVREARADDGFEPRQSGCFRPSRR